MGVQPDDLNDGRPVLVPDPLVEQALRRIGLAVLDAARLHDVFQDLAVAIRSGLDPHHDTEHPGGLLAARTGIALVTQHTWNAVPAGTRSLVASVSGTNWDFRVAEKTRVGDIRFGDAVHVSYPVQARQIAFDTLIDRIADPLAQLVRAEGELSRLGLSFGFPHLNVSTPLGIDAELITEDGYLTKGWQLTDWYSVPASRRLLARVLHQALVERGVVLTSLAVLNDTPAVALDIEASQRAVRAGLDVLPVGVVGGTGTNAAVDSGGLVNLELGNASWPDSPVSRRMRANAWSEGGPFLEHETGMCLVYRLAAGLELLGEEALIENSRPLVTWVIGSAGIDPSFLSQLASGESGHHDLLSMLARTVLRRAAQVYGAVLAALTAVAANRSGSSDAPSALLTEGSALLRADGVREHAQRVSAQLGYPVELVRASSLRGVAALSLSLSPGR